MNRMNTLLLRLMVVLGLPGAAVAMGRCPDIKRNALSKITPCAACTAKNFEDGEPLCGYCYQTDSCVEVTKSNLLTGPCSSANSTSAKHDYSLGMGGTCDCRPSKWTNCSVCASLSHLSCTWVTEGSRTNVWKIPVPFTRSTVTHTSEVSLNGTCQSVLSDETKHYEITNSNGDVLISLDTTNKVNDFFWGQCSISGATFAALVIGLGCLTLAFCAASAICACICHARAKKRRLQKENYHSLHYAAPSETTLLAGQGAPVIVYA